MSVSVHNLIQTSAEVITILHLKKGDVYQRLEEYSNEVEMRYGVVTGVLNNGTDAVITALEIGKNRYESTVGVKQQVFKTGESPKIFSTTVEEFRLHLSKMRTLLESETKKLDREVYELDTKKQLLDGVFSTGISHATTTAELVDAPEDPTE